MVHTMVCDFANPLFDNLWNSMQYICIWRRVFGPLCAAHLCCRIHSGFDPETGLELIPMNSKFRLASSFASCWDFMVRCRYWAVKEVRTMPDFKTVVVYTIDFGHPARTHFNFSREAFIIIILWYYVPAFWHFIQDQCSIYDTLNTIFFDVKSITEKNTAAIYSIATVLSTTNKRKVAKDGRFPSRYYQQDNH